MNPSIHIEDYANSFAVNISTASWLELQYLRVCLFFNHRRLRNSNNQLLATVNQLIGVASTFTLEDTLELKKLLVDLIEGERRRKDFYLSIVKQDLVEQSKKILRSYYKLDHSLDKNIYKNSTRVKTDKDMQEALSNCNLDSISSNLNKSA